MSRRSVQALVSAGAAATVLALPTSAAAGPPVGACPPPFFGELVSNAPPESLETAMKIDKNNDGRLCLKAIGNRGHFNVIDNTARAR